MRFVVERVHILQTDKYLYFVYDNEVSGKDHIRGVFQTEAMAYEHAKDLNERHRPATDAV
jgi:hypothetical protein